MIQLAGYGQASFARLLSEKGYKTDKTTINKICSGKLNPSLSLAFACAYTLGCRVDEIFHPTEREIFESVVKELINNYRISAARLQAMGVGSLSPKATNRTEEDRKINRRVELVEKN